MCCLMTSENFGCHDISRHRWGASVTWEICCFGLSEGVPWSLWWLTASPGCTAREWGATGGGWGALRVGGAFVQYAQPLASRSRPSWNRPTRAKSGQLWEGPKPNPDHQTLRRRRAGDGGGGPVTGRRAVPQEPRTHSYEAGVHSADISGPDVGAPSGDRWNTAVSLRRAAPIRG